MGGEKGIKGKQRAEYGSGGVGHNAEGAREEELSHLCPLQAPEEAAGDSVDPGEVTAGEASPSMGSQAEWVLLFQLVGFATIGQQLGGLGIHLLGL